MLQPLAPLRERDMSDSARIQPPTTIVTNARFSTGDPVRPWVTALALLGDSFETMGSAAEIMKLARTDTRVLDAHGRSIDLPAGLTRGDTVRLSFDASGEFVLEFTRAD